MRFNCFRSGQTSPTLSPLLPLTEVRALNNKTVSSRGLERVAIDWREVLLSAMDLEPLNAKDPNVEAVRGMLAIVWREAHNAGYYTNSYTTKVNPTMDFFLGKLRAAMQKLSASWERAAEERQRQKSLGASLPKARTLPQKAVQVLMRMKGAYDASTHKSACELAFPILFGHMCFASHRCWTVFVQRGLYEITDSYGQAFPAEHRAKGSDGTTKESITLTVGKRSVRLPEGWNVECDDSSTAASAASAVPPMRKVTYVDGAGNRYENKEAAMRAALFQKRAANELEPSEWLHVFDHYKFQGAEKESIGGDAATVVTSSQYDDWLFRGTNPVLCRLSLYMYSMWVYRVEKPETPSADDFLFPFDEAYHLKSAYVQRIAAEPRVPRIDGCQLFCIDSEAEREQGYKLLSLLLRPWRLPAGHANMESPPDIFVGSYDLDAPRGKRFQASWESFLQTQQASADECFKLCLDGCLWPSLWNTVEMHEQMQSTLADVDPSIREAMRNAKSRAIPLDAYLSFMACRVYQNFKAIGYARIHKDVSQLKLDEQIASLIVSDGGELGDDCNQDEPNDATKLDKSAYSEAKPHNPISLLRMLSHILPFNVNPRKSEVGKQFDSLYLEGARGISDPAVVDSICPDAASAAASRETFASKIKAKKFLQGVLDGDVVEDYVRGQRALFDAEAENLDNEDDVDESGGRQPTTSHVPRAYMYVEELAHAKRPSHLIELLVQQLAQRYAEHKPVTLHPMQKTFVHDFSKCLDIAWKEEQEGMPWTERTLFRLILIGEGGSGKSFVVQHIVIPALTWAFPALRKGCDRFLVVAHSNAQANGISTDTFRAETAHTAGCIRVQNLSNAALRPGNKLRALKDKWFNKVALIIEEAFLMPANIFNMLHVRCSWGRKQACNIDMGTIEHTRQSFGYIPIVLLLGDPLQLRPRGLGLLTDLRAVVAAGIEVHVEQEQGIKLFANFRDVWVLTGTKRFLDDDLPKLLQCLRSGKVMPRALWKSLEAQFCKLGEEGDEDAAEQRLTQPRWLDGDEIGIYWETVGRWIPRRVRRDAQRLNVPVLHIQARDNCSNFPFSAMDKDTRESVTEHILTKSNITLTGNMHGIFSAHVGMRVRLKRNVSLKQGLAQEAEGDIIDVVLPDSASPELQSAWAAQACFDEFIVEEVPLGVWVLMDDYMQNPNTDLATQKILDAGGGCVDNETGHRILREEEKDLARRLLFVERHTSFPCKVEHKKTTYKLTRTQLPLTHGRVRTCQASQGRTFKSGVTIDMTRCSEQIQSRGG